MKEIFNRIINYRFHVRPLWNPFTRLNTTFPKYYQGINNENGVKRENAIIVSLTSYEDRYKNLPLTLYSLLNQSLKPDKIILWLDKDLNDLMTLPYDITKFIKNGLEIRFVKDIGSYTKAIYTFKEFSDSIIVTADDDIYYPSDWLKKLYLSFITHPEDIHVHRAHRADLELPYNRWDKHLNEEDAKYTNFLTGVGGVLYPPKCFSKEVLRDDIFLKNAPTADDIWFWVMALIHNRKIRVVKNHIKTLVSVNIFDQLFSDNLYKKNRNGRNDVQLQALLKYYKQNVYNKLI